MTNGTETNVPARLTQLVAEALQLDPARQAQLLAFATEQLRRQRLT